MPLGLRINEEILSASVHVAFLRPNPSPVEEKKRDWTFKFFLPNAYSKNTTESACNCLKHKKV